ncbi:hypothetical protein GCM10023089_17520 [Quisquiliibacterium transsilvanicum]
MQPARARDRARAAPARAIESRFTERTNMWVVYLEAAGILVLVLLLVWWTMKDRK